MTSVFLPNEPFNIDTTKKVTLPVDTRRTQQHTRSAGGSIRIFSGKILVLGKQHEGRVLKLFQGPNPFPRRLCTSWGIRTLTSGCFPFRRTLCTSRGIRNLSEGECNLFHPTPKSPCLSSGCLVPLLQQAVHQRGHVQRQQPHGAGAAAGCVHPPP